METYSWIHNRDKFLVILTLCRLQRCNVRSASAHVRYNVNVTRASSVGDRTSVTNKEHALRRDLRLLHKFDDFRIVHLLDMLFVRKVFFLRHVVDQFESILINLEFITDRA
jgi:hypothetical protein